MKILVLLLPVLIAGCVLNDDGPVTLNKSIQNTAMGYIETTGGEKVQCYFPYGVAGKTGGGFLLYSSEDAPKVVIQFVATPQYKTYTAQNSYISIRLPKYGVNYLVPNADSWINVAVEEHSDTLYVGTFEGSAKPPANVGGRPISFNGWFRIPVKQ